MAKKDPRVDAYIAAAAPFARPILRRLRRVVHRACPDAVETMKWRFPHFEHRGPLCHMAAFQRHCAFGFWKESLLGDPQGLFAERSSAMGSLGKITSLDDLPPDEALAAYVAEARALNEREVRVVRARRDVSAPLALPAALEDALRRDPSAKKGFAGLSPGKQREYAAWIAGAKTDATRARRLATALPWMREGKGLNWKYEKKPAGAGARKRR